MPRSHSLIFTPSSLRRLGAATVLAMWCGSCLASSILIRNESLRASPSPNAKTVVQLGKGSPVDIMTRQGGWVEVSARGYKGWVRILSVRSGSEGGTSALGDVASLTQKRENKVVAVAGLRGLSEEDLKSAHYDAGEMKRLDGYQVSASQAETFAARGALKKRSVAFLAAPAKPEANNATPWENPQ